MISVETMPRIVPHKKKADKDRNLKVETTLFVSVNKEIKYNEGALEALDSYLKDFGVVNFFDSHTKWLSDKKVNRKMYRQKMQKPGIELKETEKQEWYVVEFTSFMAANSAYASLKKEDFKVRWKDQTDSYENKTNGYGNKETAEENEASCLVDNVDVKEPTSNQVSFFLYVK